MRAACSRLSPRRGLEGCHAGKFLYLAKPGAVRKWTAKPESLDEAVLPQALHSLSDGWGPSEGRPQPAIVSPAGRRSGPSSPRRFQASGVSFHQRPGEALRSS